MRCSGESDQSRCKMAAPTQRESGRTSRKQSCLKKWSFSPYSTRKLPANLSPEQAIHYTFFSMLNGYLRYSVQYGHNIL